MRIQPSEQGAELFHGGGCGFIHPPHKMGVVPFEGLYLFEAVYVL